MVPSAAARSNPATIAGVSLSNPDRVLFADQGLTKRDLAHYYERVGALMLPHVVGRPLVLVRCPQGEGKACFYQKHWTSALPDGLETVDVREESGEREPYAVVRSLAGLVALVQVGVLEMHLWGVRTDDIERPDRLVFDLDPAPDVPWSRTVAAARLARETLDALGLASWLKSSGGKGLHVVVPFARGPSWEEVHAFAAGFTRHLLALDPEGLVDVSSKRAREGRIYVDFQRNARGATTVAPWSTRARAGAPVSVPLAWDRLGTLKGGAAMNVARATRYAARLTDDPWTGLLASRQRLTRPIRSLEKLG